MMVPPWRIIWLLVCCLLVTAEVSQGDAESSQAPREFHDSAINEDSDEKGSTSLLYLQKENNSTFWQDELNNTVVRRDGIPALRYTPKPLKSSFNKNQRNTSNFTPYPGTKVINDTNAVHSKLRRRKRPSRVETDMSLPWTSAAWALASLITTPKEKSSSVTPHTTLANGTSSTTTQTLFLRHEEPTMETPLPSIPRTSSMASTTEHHMALTTQKTHLLSNYSLENVLVKLSTLGSKDINEYKATTVTVGSILKNSTEEVLDKNSSNNISLKPDSPQQKLSESLKNYKTTTAATTTTTAETLISTTTTELDNTINKSEIDKKSNSVNEEIVKTPTIGNSVSSAEKSTTTVRTTLPTVSVTSQNDSIQTTNLLQPEGESKVNETVDTHDSLINGSMEISNISDNNTVFNEKPGNNRTIDQLSSLPTSTIPNQFQNTFNYEKSTDLFTEIFSTSTESIAHSNLSVKPSVPSNFSNIESGTTLITPQTSLGTTKKYMNESTETQLNVSSTSQPKEYNEILPFSDIKITTNEKSQKEFLSTSTTPLQEMRKENTSLTTKPYDDFNVIETPKILDDTILPKVTTVKEHIHNESKNALFESFTEKPYSPNNTTKIIGTLYTVNKTVHISTKEPTSTERTNTEKTSTVAFMNLNESVPLQTTTVDETGAIGDDSNDHISDNIESLGNFSESEEVTPTSQSVEPKVTKEVPFLHTTIDYGMDKSSRDDMYGDTVYDVDVPMITRLLIQADSSMLCSKKDELKSSVLRLFKNDSREMEKKQIVINNLGSDNCLSKIPPREDGLVPVELYITNSQGHYDSHLTDNFIVLWQKDGLDFSYPVKRVEKVIGRTKWIELPTETDNSNSTIAVIIISATAGVCLLLITVLLIIIRKRHKGFTYGQRCTPVSLEDYSLDNISVYNSVRRKNTRTSKRSYGNPAFDDPGAISHVVNFATLANFCTNRGHIDDEFMQVPVVSVKPDELPPGVDNKNRFANVIPIPETRVSLPNSKQPNDKENYINANFVKGAKGEEKFYIACQAPLKETVSDFWKMIWFYQCRLIIMLTDLQEGGVEKCADYLPPSEVLDCHRVFNGLQVTLKKREVREKYIISCLQLKNLETNLWREVVHLWYVAWPHHGVPDEASSIIALLIEARSYIKSKENDSPVVVHCSPGTGRTGTIIAIDICIRDFEIKRTIDVPKTVYNIRKDRAGAVQTKDQYSFIYQVLHLYATKLTGGGLDSI